MLIKRLIAVQGDWLHVPDHAEPVKLRKVCPKYQTYPLITMQQGRVWLEGDAQGPAITSEDCKTWGPVPMALMQGRVEAVVWPPSRMHRLGPPGEKTIQRVTRTGDPELLEDV